MNISSRNARFISAHLRCKKDSSHTQFFGHLLVVSIDPSNCESLDWKSLRPAVCCWLLWSVKVQKMIKVHTVSITPYLSHLAALRAAFPKPKPRNEKRAFEENYRRIQLSTLCLPRCKGTRWVCLPEAAAAVVFSSLTLNNRKTFQPSQSKATNCD